MQPNGPSEASETDNGGKCSPPPPPPCPGFRLSLCPLAEISWAFLVGFRGYALSGGPAGSVVSLGELVGQVGKPIKMNSVSHPKEDSWVEGGGALHMHIMVCICSNVPQSFMNHEHASLTC